MCLVFVLSFILPFFYFVFVDFVRFSFDIVYQIVRIMEDFYFSSLRRQLMNFKYKLIVSGFIRLSCESNFILWNDFFFRCHRIIDETCQGNFFLNYFVYLPFCQVLIQPYSHIGKSI